jgi:FAD-NAD(P)-binding
MTDRTKEHADSILKTYQVLGKSLYVVGAFDTGVTVLSQQIRALNFAWAAVESELVNCLQGDVVPTDAARNVAIIGGGFSGLSLAGGLVAKYADVRISIFEQRDTLLPLQQGSDSRWLHPRIYDWPGEGSEAGVAMLPILNWTAARASDVVVKLLTEWNAIVRKSKHAAVALYCNARHLQIHQAAPSSKRLHLEWVGERRDPADGRAYLQGATAQGRSEDFDLVVLATGFGSERDGALSYWRNETLGQPSLDKPRQTFLVSGQGDGAMIDLLRLRISQFRQDRILDELFHGRRNLLNSVKHLHGIYTADRHKRGLLAEFEKLELNLATQIEFREVSNDLIRRLRRDTEVILHLRVKKLSQLFDLENNRISFQNKLLVYLLYKCGGFVPSALEETDLIAQHGIQPDHVIRRHGTLRDEQLKACLSSPLYEAIAKQRGGAKPDPFSQLDREQWPGGYFGYPGKFQNSARIEDQIREHWRKEYLSGPVELLATAFCAAIAGALINRHPEPGRLRVTLHRTLSLRDEELLQQSCDYVGSPDARGEMSAAARTFPAANGTIGLAYSCRQIARSVRGVDPEALRDSMEYLSLNAASRKMSVGVCFVLAIPLLQPEQPGRFTSPTPVTGVIYIDSMAEHFFIDNDELRNLVSMTEQFLCSLEKAETRPFDRIRNVELRGRGTSAPHPSPLPDEVKGQIELVSQVLPARMSTPFRFNHDYSDFIQAQDSPI